MTRNEIDDPRLQFFLERRKLIQEWARAGEAEPAAVDAFLKSLQEDLAVVAAERGAQVFTHLVAGENQLGLTRLGWGASEYPKALIGLGWGRSVRFEGSSDACWIGLRVRQSGDFRSLYERMQVAVASLGKHPTFKSRSTGGNWIEYGYFPCARPDYWKDLSGYREDILATLRQAWDRYEPIVEVSIGMSSSEGARASHAE